MVSAEGLPSTSEPQRLYLHTGKFLPTCFAGKWPLSRMNAEVSGQVLFSRKDPPAEVAGKRSLSAPGAPGATLLVPIDIPIFPHNIMYK
jgi:hypothetical protein